MALIRFCPEVREFAAEDPIAYGEILSLAMVGLRLITKTAITWRIKWRRKKLIFLGLALLVSCSEIPVKQTLNPDKFYRRDMIVSIDGHSAEGAIVVPAAKKQHV